MLKFDLTIKKKKKFKNCIWMSKFDLNKDKKNWVLFSIFWKIENRRTDPVLWVV